MNIDQQIQALINEAPQDGTTPAAVEAIAPALKLIASQLKHEQYYILQTLEQQWVMNSLSNRTQPEVIKNVIYAFPTLEDVSGGPVSLKDPQIIALPIPVIHILFQMVAMKKVDSIIFFEIPGNAKVATEVTRPDLQNLVQLHLKKLQQNSNLPPTVA
jgi:hypothetical protein